MRKTMQMTSVALATFVLSLAPLTNAHHSTAANFDRNSIITVEGIITEWRFQNPHAQILMDVTGEDGETANWMIELSAKNQLVRGGWTGEEFAVGQRISVSGWEGYR